MQITPWQWITWKSCMSHSVTSLPKLGGHICVAIQLWWCCNCVTCVLQLVCCNCVTCVLQLVCVAIQVWSCCNCVTPCVAIELLQMQLRCNCVVIVCSSRCNWELIATCCCNCCVNCNKNLNCKLGCNSKGGRFVVSDQLSWRHLCSQDRFESGSLHFSWPA